VHPTYIIIPELCCWANFKGFLYSTNISTTMAAAAANVGETTMGQDEYVETVAPKAPVTSQRFVSPHSLDAIPLPSKSLVMPINNVLVRVNCIEYFSQKGCGYSFHHSGKHFIQYVGVCFHWEISIEALERSLWATRAQLS